MTHELKLALSMSVGLHVAAMIAVPSVEPVAFDIERGPSSVEVYLVAPAPPAVQTTVEPQELPPPEPEPLPEPQPMMPEEPDPQPQTVIAPEHKGAITDARPNYLRNPPPIYPRLARQQGYEGTVLVEVQVSSSGRCEDIQVAESSGYELLDEAALRAVRQWVFKPARRGRDPVPFVVEIPITFRLMDASSTEG